MTEPARTIFLGSGSFAVPIGEALANHSSLSLVAVVTAPTRAGSRGRPTDPPVAEWAASRGLPMLRPARLRAPDSIAEIEALSPHLLVLADYGQIVPKALLELPRHGALNVHPSLLPRHRGASPIPATILSGDTETGVTLMLMDEGLDTGPIIAQARVPLAGSETAPQLEHELARSAAKLLNSTLSSWLAGEMEPRAQDHRAATITRPLRRADGRLDPSKPVRELERQVRAYQPWPGSFIETNVGRVVVWQAHVSRERSSLPVGRFYDDKDERLGLVAADGVLELVEVQLAGGRRMSGAELRRGRPVRQVVPADAINGSSA